MTDWNDSDFAVVVGINDYSDPELALTSPAQDARKITEWLTSNIGGRIPPGNVKTLIGAAGRTIDQNAIQKAFVDAKNFSTNFSRRHGISARRLYFFFSGHGLSEDTEVLLCHSLWCDDWPNANLNSNELEKKYINPCTYFDESVFWLDCCRSNGAAYVSSGLEIGCALPRQGSENQKTMLSYAALDKKYSYESIEDQNGCSLFTQVLLSALKYRGRKNDNKVSWRSVEKHLSEYVPSVAEKYNRKQVSYVDFKRTFSDEDPIFCDSALTPSLTIKTNFDHGHIIVKDSNLDFVKKIEINKGEALINLKPGTYSASSFGHSKPFQVSGVEDIIYVEF